MDCYFIFSGLQFLNIKVKSNNNDNDNIFSWLLTSTKNLFSLLMDRTCTTTNDKTTAQNKAFILKLILCLKELMLSTTAACNRVVLHGIISYIHKVCHAWAPCFTSTSSILFRNTKETMIVKISFILTIYPIIRTFSLVNQTMVSRL